MLPPLAIPYQSSPVQAHYATVMLPLDTPKALHQIAKGCPASESRMPGYPGTEPLYAKVYGRKPPSSDGPSIPSILQTGDGKPYARIEQAVKAAHPGDEIDVFPSKTGYPQTAVLVKQPLTFRAIGKIKIDGKGFDYSGAGSIPRALFQFQPTASGSSLKGFELTGASNASSNGAGIRINSASNITVSNCDIHDNDMGIMSNGTEGQKDSASTQRITRCKIHENGNLKDPGYNHNLYLAGDSVYIDHCIIWGAKTGHNLKSRAHFTSVTNSVLYGGQNRQIDCVDSWQTAQPDSNLLVYNCILAMDPLSQGNGNVIHFGGEKGPRNGRTYILQTTIDTEFLSPILILDSSGASAEIDNSIILDPDPAHPDLVGLAKHLTPDRVKGAGNLVSEGYSLANTAMTLGGAIASKVISTNQSIPGMNSTGFDVVRPTHLKPATCLYRDGHGITHRKLAPTPSWKVGADPNLFTKLDQR